MAPVWSYFKGTTDPGAAWFDPLFDDTGWEEGASPFGYGIGTFGTHLTDMAAAYGSVFIRNRFRLANPRAISDLTMVVEYVGGFVAYLNGTEVARRELGDPGTSVASDALCPWAPEGLNRDAIDLTPMVDLVLPGENLLAVEGHSRSLDEPEYRLSGTITTETPMALTRGPYLQLGSPTSTPTPVSMTIVWQTDRESEGAVRYGPSLVGTASSPGPGRIHVVRLDGLEAYTEYPYRILGDGVTLADGLRFRTFPAGAEAFRFVAFGDSGYGGPAQFAVAARIALQAPDFLVHTGDIIYPWADRDSFDPRFFIPYREILSRAVALPSLGNHDVLFEGGDSFAEFFYLPANNPEGSERYYSFDCGCAHFVALDSNMAFTVGTPQNTWLQSDLAASGARWVFVYYHHPPYSTSHHPGNAAVQEHLVPIFDAFSVDVVLCGHNHNYGRTYPLRTMGGQPVADPDDEPDYVDPEGTVYVTTGGGGAPLYEYDQRQESALFPSFHREYHIVVVDVAFDRVEMRAVAADGTVLDTMTLQKL